MDDIRNLDDRILDIVLELKFDSIVIVAHEGILQTITREFTNMDYSDSLQLFNKYGETHVLRNNYKLGDTKWHI